MKEDSCDKICQIISNLIELQHSLTKEVGTVRERLSAGDCSVEEASKVENRLFIAESTAHAFLKECLKLRVALFWGEQDTKE